MIGTFLFVAFTVMLLGGTPIGVALGLAGALAIVFGGQSIMAAPTNVYTGIAKYPLIAIPMFVLVGSVFDRTGVALRLVRFATALVGAGRGALATVSVLVAWKAGNASRLVRELVELACRCGTVPKDASRLTRRAPKS